VTVSSRAFAAMVKAGPPVTREVTVERDVPVRGGRSGAADRRVPGPCPRAVPTPENAWTVPTVTGDPPPKTTGGRVVPCTLAPPCGTTANHATSTTTTTATVAATHAR
jgi:hypothetical protein